MAIRLPQDISVPPDLYFPQDFTFGAGRPSDRLRARRLAALRRQPPYGAPRPKVVEPELGDLADMGVGTGTGTEASLRPVLGGARRVWPEPSRGEPSAAAPEELALTRQALGAARTVGGGMQRLMGSETPSTPGGGAVSGLGEVADALASSGPFFAVAPDVLSGASGGAAAASTPADLLATGTPFQIPPDVLSGASGGSAAASAMSALTPADVDLAKAAEHGAATAGGLELGGLSDWLQGLQAAGALAGMGYGLSEGGQAGERAAVSGLQNLASAGVGAYSGASLYAALPGVIGKAVETAVNAIMGEGPFGKTPLPYGRGSGPGTRFSSADNLASQISKATALSLENPLKVAIERATNPIQLLQLASQGPNLAPHGEVQFWHPDLGHGGDWQSPTDPRYAEAVQKIAETGDPETLRKFLSGIVLQTGEGGMAAPNYLLTDLFRRKLVSLLPEAHPVRQDLTGLFEETPERYRPEPWARGQAAALADARQALLNAMEPTGSEFEQPFTGYGQPAWPEMPEAAATRFQTPLSPLFRTPQEYQIPEALTQALLAGLGYPDPFPRYRALGPYAWARKAAAAPAPEPGTPEWYAAYVPL